MYPQEEVKQPRIPKVDLRALYQSFADVNEIGRQLPDQKRLFQNVYVPVDRVVAGTQRCGKLRSVPERPIAMGKHHPQLPHLGS